MTRTLWIPLALVALPAVADAQHTVLEEDFSSGVPPAGWSKAELGFPGGWVDAPFSGGSAYHDDYYGGMSDSYLVTPSLDFTGMTEVWLHAQQTVGYASWRLHHWIDVSLDGGQTWTHVHDDTAPDGTSSLRVDLSDYAGLDGVHVAFHYEGDYASEWEIDDVAIDDQEVRILGTVVRPATGVTYHLLEPSGWAVAETAARSLGGHLAAIGSQGENDWVLANFGGTSSDWRDLWIGYTDLAQEGNFSWTNGEPDQFENWTHSQPDNSRSYDPGGEQYVVMHGAGSWSGPGYWSDTYDPDDLGWNSQIYGVVEVDGPVLQVEPLFAGEYARFSVRGFEPGDWAVIAWSTTGNGPTSTPWGSVALSDPILTFPSFKVDETGEGGLDIWFAPETVGMQYWFQALDYEAQTFTNGTTTVVR